MSFRLSAFVLIAALAAAPAWAQKPRAASPLELGADPVTLAPSVTADGQQARVGTRAVALFSQDAVVRPAAPEAMAREFLASKASVLGLREADMEMIHLREGNAGTTVRFQQTHEGVPVWGTESAVGIDTRGRVQSVFNNTRDIAPVSTTPALASVDARTVAHAHLGISGTLHLDETALMVWPGDDATRLVWQVRVEAQEPRGDWEVMVDAQTGELVRVADRMLTHSGDDDPETPLAIPTVETHPLYSRVDGTGFIFDPDPLTRAGVPYGGGYVDGAFPGDRDTPQLEAARTAVTLRDITQNGSMYELRGPWAHILDWDTPFNGIYSQSTPTWDFPRSNDAFEAATVYWHIDNYMRYVNETLGISALPQAYTGGVRFDPHGWFRNGSDQDNSSFSPGTDRLTFGHGCVDDSEDADVILHELGHGLDDWLSGSTNQPDGLSEGFGDYVAVSYTRGLGLLSPSDASYNWVFKWDGHNPCWSGRRTNLTTNYPSGSVPHARGQHFATSLMRVWDILGQEKTDRAVYEGFALTAGTVQQPQQAQAILQAAANMGYTSEELNVFLTSFQDQGYSGLTIPVANERENPEALPVGIELSAPRPNPFFGTTQVEIRVDDAQHVTVEVYDAIGRRVATLMDEALVAGRRYPVTLDGRGLKAGVYVVRVRGESVEASQRVTLTK